MDWPQTVAIVGAAGMFVTGVGGLIVSWLGQRSTAHNVAVDTANDALAMARSVWQEKIASLEVALAEERARSQERTDALERRLEALSAELTQVRAAQLATDSRAAALQRRVQELEAENQTLQSFVEQLKLRNEALMKRLGGV